MSKYTNKAKGLFERFGSYSLVIGYFFPVIRHVIPYIVGMAKMPYSKYALLSYSTGFAWTLFYFTIGRYFGNNINTIANFLATYKLMLVAAFVLFCALLLGKELIGERRGAFFTKNYYDKWL